MTPKLEQAARQALEAMIASNDEWARLDVTEAITALREALVEQAEQEPVLVNVDERRDSPMNAPLPLPDYRHIYAAPVRTKDLTDDEIDALAEQFVGQQSIALCRAVIAADREKNK